MTFKIKGGWLKVYRRSTGISCAISREDLLCSPTCKYCLGLGLALFCFVVLFFFLTQMLAKQIEPYKHN